MFIATCCIVCIELSFATRLLCESMDSAAFDRISILQRKAVSEFISNIDLHGYLSYHGIQIFFSCALTSFTFNQELLPWHTFLWLLLSGLIAFYFKLFKILYIGVWLRLMLHGMISIVSVCMWSVHPMICDLYTVACMYHSDPNLLQLFLNLCTFLGK